MNYVYAVITLLAGIGVFLFGFKVLTDSTEKLADNNLKRLFNKTSNKKLVSMGIGAVTTAIVQSSAVIIVMVVGLANAGIITLVQATAMIMGANIGTTISAQIVALQAFDVVKYATALSFIGIVINMACKSDKMKSLGLLLAGLGLVFVGLEIMSGSMDEFKNSEFVVNSLISAGDYPILLFFIGVLLTALVQSSSAVTSVLVTMAGSGIIIGATGSNAVYFIILGTNVGTCVTALISSIGTNANARRASLIHLMFNVLGSLLFMILMLVWKDFKAMTFDRWFAQPETGIAMFHTFFNVVCVAIFLPMTKLFVKVSTWLIKDGGKKVPNEPLSYLDERFLKAPSVALTQTVKECCILSDEAFGILGKAFDGFEAKDGSVKKDVDIGNNHLSNLNRQVVAFLVKISMLDVSLDDKKKISSLHYVLNDIMRVGELADNICKYTSKSLSQDLVFSPEVMVDLREMFDKITELFERSMETFRTSNKKLLPEVDAIEDEVDNLRRTLIDGHINRLNEGVCSPSNSTVFINLVGNLERAADHISFIAHSIELN